METLNTVLQHLFPSDRAFATEYIWQLLLLIALGFAARLLQKKVFPTPDKSHEHFSPRLWLRHNGILPILLGLCILAGVAGYAAGVDVPVVVLVGSILFCWILIGLITSFIKDRFWAESTALVLVFILTVYALTWSNNAFDILSGIKIEVGTFTVTAKGLLTGFLAMAFALWLSLGISRLLEKKIENLARLTPSARVLAAKVVRILFIAIALLVGIQSMGVDLSMLTVLGGAVGLGLGFGLQKIVANLLSGMILLTDRSIKPGDVIEIDGTYGHINTLRARYVSVLTRDGKEHLIPNEDLITQRVINWSYSNDLLRLRCPIGISYGADPHQAIRICEEAALQHERVLKNPVPKCLLRGFGDNSVDLELRFWINDPSNGISNIRSAVLLTIWDRFKEEGIEIPFPQRDLHLRSAVPLEIRQEKQ